MKWLFIAAQAIALGRLLWVRFPYPWFITTLTLWTLQALNVTLVAPTAAHPAEWTRTWWRYPEALLILVTVVAVVESLRRSRWCMEDRLNRLILCGSAVTIAATVVIAGIRFVSPLHGDAQDHFNQVRAWTWALLAISMVVTELLLTLRGIARSAEIRRHSRLLMTVMVCKMLVAPVVDAPEEVWQTARELYRPLIILCCFCWATCFQHQPIEPHQDGVPCEVRPTQNALL